MPDFSLDDWADVYEFRLSQVVNWQGEMMTTTERYEMIQGIVSVEGEAAAKYREKLFGVQVVVVAPTRYYELAAMHNLGISPREWSGMSLEQRGEQVAYLRLSNKVQFIERHEELQREEYRKLHEKKDG